MHYIALATEDELSEAVGIRLVAEVASACEVNLKFRRGGYGYLKSKLDSFCQIARRQPLLLLTDLDEMPCAPELIAEWMEGRDHPEKFMFRVAVREVEAWLLADHEAMKGLLGRKITKLPAKPDTLSDPKQTLMKLARKAPRLVRNDLLREHGALALRGLGYNVRLCAFVRDMWNPERAAVRSDSLRRVRECLRALAATHS
jgi:Domain of unknown function (DUF4276)